jgi:TonB family protein
VIAHEHLASGLNVVRSGAGHGTLVGFAHPGSTFPSRRTVVFLLIVAVHALLIYGFASAFVRGVIKMPTMISGVVLDSPTKHPPPTPSIDPDLNSTRPLLPRLGDVFLFPPDDPGILNVTSERPPGEASTPSLPHIATRVVGGAGQGFPRADDYYPSSARRLGEQGAATVQVCVDERGRLSAEPKIAHSSGSSRLDEGALRLAKAGSGHYQMTTEDNRPVSDCYPLRIRFQLMD